MERRRKPLLYTLALGTALLIPFALFLQPVALPAQSKSSSAGIDPQLLARAKAGQAKAQFYLGLAYDNGQGVPQDFVQAANWYRKAAEQGGADAQNNLGVLYYNGQGVPQDFVQAANWWRKAAEQGYAGAQNNLGVLYGNGQGVPQDHTQAYFWFDLAAAGAKGEDQKKFAENRDLAAEKLSPAKLSEVQQRAAKWFTNHPSRP